MKKLLFAVILLLFPTFLGGVADAQEEKGRAYYDFGVFAYEDGDYEDAEKNFEKALALNPDNPFCNHYLGRTYLKTDRYPEARSCFEKAWNRDPEIPGLTYDIAFLDYKMSNYSIAADRFRKVAKEEPSNVLASYYAGICLYNLGEYADAVGYFVHAAEKSPTISTNGYYYAGICYQRMGDIRQAEEKFAYVGAHADSGSLRENAAKWLSAVRKQEKTLKPYRIYLKIGRRHDDNVRLVPSDQNIEDDKGADKGDGVTVAYFSGDYKFVDKDGFNAGAGYSHYQTWHDDLDQYDLTGSIFNLYTHHRSHPFTFGFAYLPAYYWADSESYLRRHQFKPEMIWALSSNLVSRVSYSFYDDTYLQHDDRSGEMHEVFLDMFYSLPNVRGNLFGGFGWEKNDASGPDYDYGQIKTKLGISLYLPWHLNLKLTGKYYDKQYENPDSSYGVKRDDGKTMGTVSLSRRLFYDGLDISAEFGYTKNDSNFNDYDYEKKVTTLSLILRH